MTINAQDTNDEVVGFIDLGTNAVRLLVARFHDVSYSLLSLQRQQVRLGEGEFGTGRLEAAAIERTVTAIAGFAALARSLGATRIVGAATSALREATNQAALVDRLEREVGVSMRTVSGREEARLIMQAVRHRIGLGGAPIAVFDIGGGSTEIAVGNSESDLYLDSLKIGALRLASDRFGLDREEPVSADEYRALRRSVEVASVYATSSVKELAPVAVYGTSGTIRALAAVAARAEGRAAGSADDADESVLTLAELGKVGKLLRRLTLSERRNVPGLPSERADVIVAGAAVLEALMAACAIAEIRALARCGLREGLLYEDLEKRDPGRPIHRTLVRERSVAGLARTADDDGHAAQVTRLALQLMDSGREAGLYRYGDHERELLGYAARLHDIGKGVSYHDHHVHGAYLIRNGDLLGFDQTEIALMATIVLLHRKALSPGGYPGHPPLDRRNARTARTLALLLRIAELLDRSHTGAVTEARLARGDDSLVRLEIVPGADMRLERWGLENRLKTLQKGLGHEVEIVVLDRRRGEAGQA